MGKITVKHYLNTNLKPDIDDYDNTKYYPVYLSITVESKNIKRKSNITSYIGEIEFKSGLKNKPDIKRHLEYEVNLITRIIKLYQQDIENNKVNRGLMLFFDLKGYNSKDEYINILNAYIDFYSHSIFEAICNFCNHEIEKEVFAKLTSTFNLSNQSEAKKIFNYQTPLSEVEFIYQNLSRESIEFLILRERIRNFLAPYSNKTGYDIPLIDWLDNIIQKDLIDFLKTYKRKTEYYLLDGFTVDNQLIDKFMNIINSIIYSPNYIEIAKRERKINI